MKLYKISGGTGIPTYAAGVVVARAVKRDLQGSSMEATKDEAGPPGCTSLTVKKFKLEFPAQMGRVMLERLEKAEQQKGYFRVVSDRDALCMSADMRKAFIKKLENLIGAS